MTKTTLQDLARIIKEVLKSDRDFVCVLTGLTGEGKSTFQYQLAKELDPNFTFERNTVFTKWQFEEVISKLPKYSVVCVDEAINVLFKRDFMDKDQKRIIRILNMCRDSNLCIILTLPCLWDLDKTILQSGRVRCWSWIGQRGYAHLFEPKNNPFSTDLWNIKENKLIFDKMNDFSYVPVKCRNHIGTIEYGALSPEEHADYVRVKNKMRQMALDKEKKENENKIKELVELFDRGYYWCLKELQQADKLKYGALNFIQVLKKMQDSTLDNKIKNAKPLLAHIEDEISKSDAKSKIDQPARIGI